MAVISEGIAGSDIRKIEEILRSTDFFYDFEIEIALEIARETVTYGTEKSGYYWIKAVDEDGLVAFANFGKEDFSTHSWELYWIAVHDNSRNKKLGSLLLKSVENKIRELGGKILWIETSGRPLYKPTEEFYRRNGYELAASLKDFYSPGDPKQIYVKTL